MLEIFAIKALDEKSFSLLENELKPIFPDLTLEKLEKKKGFSRQNSWLGEALSRYAIAKSENMDARKVAFITNGNGKPMIKYPAGLHHNMSHSGDWVVTAISSDYVGVDIERIRTGKMKIAERYFTTSEFKKLQSFKKEKEANDYFFELWTLKESYLKALGTGLTKWLNTFSIHQSKNGNHYIEDKNHDSDFHLHQYNIDPQYKLAICSKVKNENSMVKIVTAEELKDYIFSLEAFKI